MEYLKKRGKLIEKYIKKQEIKKQKLAEKKTTLEIGFFSHTVEPFLDEYKRIRVLDHDIVFCKVKSKKVSIILTNNKTSQTAEYFLFIETIGGIDDEENTLIRLVRNDKQYFSTIKINALTETPNKFKKTFNKLFKKLDKEIIRNVDISVKKQEEI